MSELSSEIVVGIDFGTTHSGVSWAVNGGSKVIRLINNWPDPTAQNASKDKVPSSISYVDGKPQKWGYTVGLTDESFRWVKILLEENHKYISTVEPVKNSNRLLTKVDKKAYEVVADYLKLLWEYTLDDIQKFHPTFREIFALRVVLTVPAMWSPAAKDKTLQAARLAGMPSPIKLVTEPEAAALATLKDKAADNTLKVKDAFIVCDAGGGTVVREHRSSVNVPCFAQDLISYEVQQLNPLKIKECAIGDGMPEFFPFARPQELIMRTVGGLCGSVFLDTSFQKYIETIVGEAQYNSIKETNRKKMMKEFEYGIKRTFSEKNDQTYSVDLRGVKDDYKNNVIDDTITVTIDALRVVFDHVSLQIENLISEQIAQVLDKGLTVKCHSGDGIHVMQVNGAWSSICRGATMWGLEHSDVSSSAIGSDTPTQNPTVTSRLSRYSYGLLVDQYYDERVHHIDDIYLDYDTGGYLARDQMTWLLKRGDEVEEGRFLETSCEQIVKVGFWDNGLEMFSSDLFYNDESTPPTRLTDSKSNQSNPVCHKTPLPLPLPRRLLASLFHCSANPTLLSKAVRSLCTVNYGVDRSNLWHEKSFKSPVTREKLRKAMFDMAIILGNATLEFVISYRGQTMTSVAVDYPEQV
ncbi:MAG: hypothetical protein Q9199_000795 [Rusavskia elegans]